jgi:hypothetical protein
MRKFDIHGPIFQTGNLVDGRSAGRCRLSLQKITKKKKNTKKIKNQFHSSYMKTCTLDEDIFCDIIPYTCVTR